MAEFNNLETLATDIGNASLNGYNKEKVCLIAGDEFGDMAGCVLIIEKALYGLRGSPAAFHLHLSQTLAKLGYFPTKADLDLWMNTTWGGLHADTVEN